MRPSLTRSPAYLLTLLAGAVVSGVGWAIANLFERTVVATAVDIGEVIEILPERLETAPAAITAGGMVAAAGLGHVWLIRRRHFRRLFLVDTAAVVAVGLSAVTGEIIISVARPSTQVLFDDAAGQLLRSAPTNPAVAGLIAGLFMVRPWLPARSRPSVYGAASLLVLVQLAVVESPPYLGLVLDIGVGMVAASIVALLLRTPNLQPDRDALILGLAESGLGITDLDSADVDARGSEPWIGTSTAGEPVFVKALSTDQRAADLLFRAMRWVRLRRTGDAPPEASLRRVAEHEALIAHHARSLGVATPRVLAVATVGPKKVALAYEGVTGRSLDKVPAERITDDVLRAVWEQILRLRRHRIAHRDLRLANVFLTDEDQVLLIDFGFAELGATDQLLDTDVAELLAATSTVVGTERAARVAIDTIGRANLEAARDWLHPLAFSTATRRAMASTGDVVRLRDEVDRLTGHTVTDYERLGRLSPSRLLGLVLAGVGVYSLVALVAHEEIAEHVADIDVQTLAAAMAIGLCVPVLGAMAYRSATGRRVTFRALCRASFAALAPVSAPTTWAFTNRILSDTARDQGVAATSAKRAASERCTMALVSAPLLVSGFAAAGFVSSRGQLFGIVPGLAAGAIVAAAQFLLLFATPAGRELGRVWLDPFRTPASTSGTVIASVAWTSAATTAQGTAFALGARAAGIGTRFELLVAVGIGCLAVASLLPVPGGVGSVELLTGGTLLLDNPLALAVLGAVLARIVLFWVALPVSVWAYRSTRHYRARHQGPAAVAPVGTAPTGSLRASPTPPWWS